MTWPFAAKPFASLELGLHQSEVTPVATFEFFRAVPKEVWWDNPKTVATLILLGRQRQCHPRYAALASHYVFEPRFCMPRRGNEKPDAESTVKAVQKVTVSGTPFAPVGDGRGPADNRGGPGTPEDKAQPAGVQGLPTGPGWPVRRRPCGGPGDGPRTRCPAAGPRGGRPDEWAGAPAHP